MGGTNTAEMKKRFILVVDNNVDDRFHTSMVLQRFGYNICTARSGEEAVEFMSVSPPAAVVSEAGLTGAGLLSRVKKDARFLDVPLILVSTRPDQALEDRARRGEYAAFLRKPVDVEELYRVIQSAVEKTPRRNIRIAVYLKAKLEDDPEGTDAFVTVISEYGMFFRTLEPRPANTRVPVTIEIKGRSVKLEAVVLYASSFDEGPFKEPGMGMKFVKISPEDQALIKTFILEQVGSDIVPPGA